MVERSPKQRAFMTLTRATARLEGMNAVLELFRRLPYPLAEKRAVEIAATWEARRQEAEALLLEKSADG